jgi:hypothetical protein
MVMSRGLNCMPNIVAVLKQGKETNVCKTKTTYFIILKYLLNKIIKHSVFILTTQNCIISPSVGF